MNFYTQWQAVDLPYNVGCNRDNVRISDGEEGVLSYGPYFTLPPGRYFGGFLLKRAKYTANFELGFMDVVHSGGEVVLKKKKLSSINVFSASPGFSGVQFDLDRHASDVEVRLHVLPNVKVELHKLIIVRCRPSVDDK